MNYWLVKTEPAEFSIQDLARCPDRTTSWGGVRNYQARNFLRDTMKNGDRVLVYHSNADPPAVAGTAKVVRQAYPDPSALVRKSPYYDAKSTPENPRWFMVDIQLESIFAQPLPLDSLRSVKALENMELLRRGSRLSVQPVSSAEYKAICRLANEVSRSS